MMEVEQMVEVIPFPFESRQDRFEDSIFMETNSQTNSSTDDQSDSLKIVVIDRKRHSVKRRNKRRLEDNPRAQFYLPRIPRRDIRRQYAAMFSNVYNSHDYDFMKKFTNSLFSPEVVVLFRKTDGGVLQKEAECHGQDHSLAVWYDSVLRIPDMVFSLGKSQIKVRSDGTAVISSTFTITGTKVHTKNVSTAMLSQEITDDFNIKLRSNPQQACPFAETSTLLPVTVPNTNRQFDQEFVEALTEYLDESDPIREESTNNTLPVASHIHTSTFPTSTITTHDPLQPQYHFSSPEQQIVIQEVHADGYFSLHLDEHSNIYYVTYVLNGPDLH